MRVATKGRYAVIAMVDLANHFASDQPSQTLASISSRQNVSLSYDLPSKIFEKSIFSSVRFYANVQNLYTFTKYTGFDPEVSTNGIDNNIYPLSAIYTFGTNITF